MMDKSGIRLPGEINTILKKVSRTLYLSVNILPEPVRTQLGLGYLLCRALDTVTDASGISAVEKLEVLELAKGFAKPEAQAGLARKFSALAGQAPQPAERELLAKSARVFSVFASLPPADKPLFSDLVSGVAAGMETDVRAFPGGAPAALQTGADLENYCRLIGGLPGVFWARLYRGAIRGSNSGAVNFPSEKDAEMIGSALQLTNILKDLAADLRLGRCYLPQEDLDTRNLKPADLLNPANMGRVRELTAKWTCWAVDRLDQCEAFVTAIPKTELALRAAVIWPVYWAMDTLEETAHSNLLDPADRPRIRRSRVYATIAATPPLLLSNTAFARGYRFRRETLISSITGGNYEGRAL
jgi:farnesyl-diphosphate farnesyltransferase